MNVLLVNTTCLIGGVSTFLLSLRSQLAARGHGCELFFFERGTMTPHLPADCPVHFGTLADCLRLVSSRPFHAVHANNIDWPTGLSAVRELGATLTVTAHKARERAWTQGWRRRNCDAFVTVSRWLRDELQPHTDVSIQAIYNGIDTSLFHPDDDAPSHPPIVAWVGRGSAPLKRLDAFAAIAPALRARGFRIWVVDPHGPARLSESSPRLARQLATAAEKWEGVAYERMPDVYRTIAASGGCVVSTASVEGLGLALLEAQACGCVVIAADVKGVNECVTPPHGLLYPYDLDPAALAALIADTLADKASMRAAQIVAAAYVRDHFSIDRMTERYLAIYASGRKSEAPRMRAPMRPAAAHGWKSYCDWRLGVGYAQYDASRALAAAGDWTLATAAARAALGTAPTIYLRPRRARHLAHCLWELLQVR
jgi:glycosyltransferase involved in cell wall biosynthesis